MKWPTMYQNDNNKTGLDYSNPYEDIFEEIPPYTKGQDGKWLNETSEPIIKKTGKVNIQEKIDSFKDETDIYKILEKVAASGDDISVQSNQCVDISNIPTDYNTFNEYVGNHIDALQQLPKEISSLILKDDLTEKELTKAIENYNNSKKEDKKEEENNG